MEHLKLHTWYRPEQTIMGGSMVSNRKPGQVVAANSTHLVVHADFEPITAQQLYAVHDKEYVDQVLAFEESNGFGNKDQVELGQALMHCGSFLAASLRALEEGITFSPSQGFHHAGYDHNSGYCTFNGLMVAAKALIDRGLRVAILDGDAHFGDGTEDIIGELRLTEKQLTHVTFREVTKPMTNADDIAGLEEGLQMAFRRMHGVDIILYQAGADAHIDDPYGCGALSSKAYAARDWFTFSFAARYNTPIAFNLAGGYQPDGKVVELHKGTIIQALRNLISYGKP